MVKRALLIGINYVKTANELNGCINDVNNVKKCLIEVFQYSTENIKLMSDNELTTLRPTKQNILTQLSTIVNLTKTGDTLFIHYSGHGTQVLSLNLDEIFNLDGLMRDDAIVPLDFGTSGFIVDDDLRKNIVEKVPNGAKLRVFLDCCHSGTGLDLPYNYKIGETFTKMYNSLPNNLDCVLISGCKDSQTSADAYVGGVWAGALTRALLPLLKNSKTVPTTWKQLLMLVRHSLLIGGYSQIPLLSVGAVATSKLTIDI